MTAEENDWIISFRFQHWTKVSTCQESWFFMGVSPVKIPNINIDTILNRPQINNSNILPSNNCNSNTPLDKFNQHVYKEPNKKLSTHLSYTDHTYSMSKKQPSNKYNTDNLRIFHQNIRGLYSKVDELTTHWLNQFPHILCNNEHHLRDYEIGNMRRSVPEVPNPRFFKNGTLCAKRVTSYSNTLCHADYITHRVTWASQ